MNTAAPVIALDHPAALDAARVGRKAANLAAARAAGLPVGPGVVLTTDWMTEDHPTAGQVWRITSHDGTRPLAVRASNAGRDRRRPDAVGAIEPTTVVHDLESMLAAVARLRAEDARTPVLVQPHAAGSWEGVLFADDRSSGRRATAVVVARPADAAEPGEWIAELDQAGRVRDVLSSGDVGAPPDELLARLARLADRVNVAFDGPHDIEWFVDTDGRVQLLRVRPVVRLRAAAGRASRPLGATFGPTRARRHHPSRLGSPYADVGSVDEPAA